MSSLETSFLNLVRGSRLTNYMGLRTHEDQPPTAGTTYKFASDYAYIQIPIWGFRNTADGDDTPPTLKASRNQYVEVLPVCRLNVRGSYRVLVEPNPALAAFGMTQGSYYVQPGSGITIPLFHMQMRRDLDLTPPAAPTDGEANTVSDSPYAIRLYLRT